MIVGIIEQAVYFWVDFIQFDLEAEFAGSKMND